MSDLIVPKTTRQCLADLQQSENTVASLLRTRSTLDERYEKFRKMGKVFER